MLQGVCLVCSFYHEFAHWTLEARQPSRFVTEMLLCILVQPSKENARIFLNAR